jgi:hypothetical protein
MNGSETDPGIIHRAVKDIFTKIQMVSSSVDVIEINVFVVIMVLVLHNFRYLIVSF